MYILKQINEPLGQILSLPYKVVTFPGLPSCSLILDIPSATSWSSLYLKIFIQTIAH